MLESIGIRADFFPSEPSGEGIGNDITTLDRIEALASESKIDLHFSEDEKRDHAIHATVPANQTEIALQSLCAALDLLAL